MSNRQLGHIIVCVLLLLAVGFGAGLQKATAATIVVTTGQDGPVGSVPGCSLREAINAVNSQANGNGCTNSSTLGYGNNDLIRFANTLANLTVTQPAGPFATASVLIQRRVLIRGNVTPVTTISGNGSTLNLIENVSQLLRLRDIRLRNAGSALMNMPDATAELVRVQAMGHSRRAIVNRGRMDITDSIISGNPGGGIANANSIPTTILGSSGNLFEFVESVCPQGCPADDCPPFCHGNEGAPNPIPENTVFPPGHATSAMTIVSSLIRDNGPIACAGVVNGGGLVAGQPGGIGGIGGNPLAPQEKLEGALTIRRSQIIDNRAGSERGGGICNQSTLMISQSEIAGNRAGRGGGLAALGLPLSSPVILARPFTAIANSTISTNFALTTGGGILVETRGGDLVISSSTIASNSSDGTSQNSAGGIAAEVALNATFRFSALTNNSSAATGLALQDCANVNLTGNFNFWGVTNTGTCSLVGQNNITTGAARLGVLATNGDPATRSRLPATTSALVDVIPTTSPSCGGFDQRQRTRPRDGNSDGQSRCDIGAIERP